MSAVWTQAQEAAINTRNKTLLLSAAAGSGKTSTLTERIIRSITDENNPADISKMLIVTFTRASAADLKAKIFNAISAELAKQPKNKHLASQLIKLGGAQISTIDSFYVSSVRQNFSSLGLSSAFRVADETETELISKNVLCEVINRFYDTDEDFSSLCECFEKLRDTEGFMESVLLDLYIDCRRTPEGVEYLKICANAAKDSQGCDFFKTEYGTILKKYTLLCLADYLRLYEDILAKMPLDEKLYASYFEAFSYDRHFLLDALNILEGKSDNSSYTGLCELFYGYSAPALKSIGKAKSDFSSYCKDVRDKLKKDISSMKEHYFCYSEHDFPRFFELTAKNLDLLFRVLSEFDKEYAEEKKRRGILELTDIKRLTLRLFVEPDGTPTKLAVSTSNKYSDIYIDEYQDVDPVQDLIFRSISRPTNRFMVGDIKQSIYNFRGAMPTLFAGYRSSFPVHGTRESQDSSNETIFMSENFRCAKPIIDFTNLAIAPLFYACGDSLGYSHEDDLVYARIRPDNALPDVPVTVALFAKNSKKDRATSIDNAPLPTPAEAEAEYIASEIHKLLTHGHKQDGTPIRPSDIAVLFRNKSTARRISDALTHVGIMTSENEAVQYFNNPDVLLMLSILNTIDNPQRDVYLAGCMYSPIFGFTLDDLLLINSIGDTSMSLYDKVCLYAECEDELSERCQSFISQINEWRSIAASLPIDKLLSRIFESDTFVASGLYTEKNALGKGGHLKRLYEYARTFEAGSFKGLYNFIEFINSLIESGKTIDAKAEGFADGCVTLTTIHKSKGLEFPVCFVCDCAHDFKLGSSNPDLTFRYGKGVAMTLSDSTGLAYYTSPLKKMLDLESDFLGVEEEMRVLYVALTRARERLYVSASYSQAVMPTVLSAANFHRQVESNYFTLGASCFMDWILPAALSSKGDCTCVHTYTTDALPDFSSGEYLSASEEKSSADMNRLFYEELKAKYAFKYPYEYTAHIPAKLSVSRLSPDILDNSDDSLDIFESEGDISIPEFFSGKKEALTPAQRGTATHLFLQFCDFSMLKKQGAEECLSYLTEKRFIPPKMAQGVYLDELVRFSQGELIDEILTSSQVIRERRFNILLDAADFTLDKTLKEALANEKIAVQGVIDLILIDRDESIRLYDYKTDRLTKEELADPLLAQRKLQLMHGEQLSYYARAVEMLFGQAPSRICVYSTHAARLYDIDVDISHDIL